MARKLTAIGFVREWCRRGMVNTLPVPAWEKPYQDAGLIHAAWRKGYIWIGSDVGCTITLEWRRAHLFIYGPPKPRSLR